jgi:hypothetical protein
MTSLPLKFDAYFLTQNRKLPLADAKGLIERDSLENSSISSLRSSCLMFSARCMGWFISLNTGLVPPRWHW